MSIKITYTGYLKDITNIQTEEIATLKNTDALIEKINHRFPVLQNTYYILSVNGKRININSKLKSGDKILLICPFAGG